MAAITAPTVLYHASEAQQGRVFHGSEKEPLEHPGDGWFDNPADAGLVPDHDGKSTQVFVPAGRAKGGKQA